MNKNKESLLKFLTDFLPLIIFFYVYKTSKASNPLIEATIYLVIVTLIAIGVSYLMTKKIAMLPLVSAIILGFFGTLTVLLHDETFIKLKPTIINIVFAAILLFGYLSKKPLLSYLIGDKIKITNEAWLTLSLRWGLFFVFLAILNEIIWRNFSTDFWVQFKVFGMMPLSFLFTISQLPFMIKKIKEFEGNIY